MKTFVLVLSLLIGSWYTSLAQCTSSVLISGTDSEAKLSICNIEDINYFVITQRLLVGEGKNYRVHIKDGTPLFFVDEHKSVHRIKLHGYEYNSISHKNVDLVDCGYYYIISPQLLNYLLLHPIELLFMYRDDHTEMYTLTEKQQLELYNIVKAYYEDRGWKLKLD